MALWQWLFGVGLGTVLTLLVMTVPRRQIHSSRRKDESFSQDINDNCPICLGTMQPANTVYLPCCHAIHESCFQQLKLHSKLCPQCRGSFET